MIAQISAVKMDTESGNIMKITVFDGKTVAQATEFPSHEPSVKCDHGACLVFPRKAGDKQMHLCNFFFFRSIRSSTIFTSLIHQGGKTKYEGV